MSDVGDLLELLHGARDRWTTLQCSFHYWHHTARGDTANERWLAAARGSVQMYAQFSGERPATTERIERLWIAKPDRLRVEGEHHTHVTRGDSWWSWSTYQGFMSNEHDVESHTGDPLEGYAAHLDPAGLIPQIEVERIEGATVHVRPRDDDTYGPGLPHGADRHVLTVDARGVVVRIESLVDGEPFLVSELVDPVWDEPIDEAVFALDVPVGEEVVSPRDLHSLELTLEEAAARASFAVWAVAELPDGIWRARAHHHRARGEQFEQLTILYNRVDGRALIHVVQHASGEQRPWARIHGAAQASTVRDGTHVSLQSEDVDEKTLRSLAETLVRV